MRFPSLIARRAATIGLCLTLAVPMSVSIRPEPAIARGAPDSFADLAAKLLPAVLNISSSQSAQTTQRPVRPSSSFSATFSIASGRRVSAARGRNGPSGKNGRSGGRRVWGRASSSTPPVWS